MVRIAASYVAVFRNIEEGFAISRTRATTGTLPSARQFFFTVEAKRVSFP